MSTGGKPMVTNYCALATRADVRVKEERSETFTRWYDAELWSESPGVDLRGATIPSKLGTRS